MNRDTKGVGSKTIMQQKISKIRYIHTLLSPRPAPHRPVRSEGRHQVAHQRNDAGKLRNRIERKRKEKLIALAGEMAISAATIKSLEEDMVVIATTSEAPPPPPPPPPRPPAHKAYKFVPKLPVPTT